MAGLYTHVTRATGTILTATIYNTDHQNHIDNQTPQMTDDYSVSVAEMRTVTSPGGVGTESLATSLSGELERLRYVIGQLTGGSQWYDIPGGRWIELFEQTLSAVGPQDFETASWFDGTYSELLFVFRDLTMTTDNTDFWARVKAGGSYQADAGDYRADRLSCDGGSSTVGYTPGTATLMTLGFNIDGLALEGNYAAFHILNPLNQTTYFHRFTAYCTHLANDGGFDRHMSDFRYQTKEAVTGIRFSTTGASFSARCVVLGRRA